MDKDVAKMLKCRHRGRHYQLRWNWIVDGTKFGATYSLCIGDEQWSHHILKDVRRKYCIPSCVPTEVYVSCHDCCLYQLIDLIKQSEL
jgi:hypothetical protein